MNEQIEKAFKWIIKVDENEIKYNVNYLKQKYPGLSNKELSTKVFSRSKWKTIASGVLTGLASNPFLSVGSAFGDLVVVLKTEINAAAMVALIYDPDFFNDKDAAFELLIPIFGIDMASQAVRELGMRGTVNLTRQLIKKYLAKETLKQFKKVMLKNFGLKITQKALITKTVPIVGGIIGGTWNWIEITIIRNRVIKYFENESIGKIDQ